MSNIPRTMSTQRPDNARPPFFISGGVIGGEEEILEAYFAFSHLDYQEQMWDFEDKKALPWVVSELLAKIRTFSGNMRSGKRYSLHSEFPIPKSKIWKPRWCRKSWIASPGAMIPLELFTGKMSSPCLKSFFR
jgi:phosphoenolpyruvate carboxylase